MNKGKQKRRGICLLSLDGGGPGSISQLRLIGEYVTRLAHDLKVDVDTLLPAECFDLIGGSGFGGFVALLLGRLGLTVEQATDELINIACVLFPNGQIADVNPQANTTRLRDAVQDLLQRHSLPVGLMLNDQTLAVGAQCKVAIFVSPSVNVGHCQLFRTYPSRHASTIDNLTFVDAVCATLAIPKLFVPLTIGTSPRQQTFISASFGFNNPTQEVLKEAERVFETDGPITLTLSLGSGRPNVMSLKKEGDDYDSLLSRMVVDCEKVAQELSKQSFRSGTYLRLNVDRGLEDIKMSDWDNLGEIESHTNVYIDVPAITTAIDSSLLILQYARSQRLSNRAETTCPICLEGVPLEDAFKLTPCDHALCKQCANAHVNAQLYLYKWPVACALCVANKSNDPGVIGRDIVEQLGDEKALALWEKLGSMNALRKEGCPSCGESHNESRHPVSGTNSFLDRTGIRGMRRCPGCGSFIERHGGCSHMICRVPGCNTHFCGECGGLLGRGTTNASDDQVKIWEAVRKHFADGCRLTDYYD